MTFQTSNRFRSSGIIRALKVTYHPNMDENKKIKTYNYIKQSLNVSSKNQVKILIDAIHKNPKLLLHVYKLAISNEHPFAWRASWTLVHLTTSYPNLIKPFAPQIIRDINHLKIDRQVASFLQILTKIDFPTDEAGHLFDLSVRILHDTKKQMYFKLYALQFLMKFVEKVPELIPELLLSVEDESLISNNKYIRKKIMKLREKIS